MFEILSSAARWEVEPGYAILMKIPYLLLILFYILALLSIVLLIFITVKKDSLNSRRSKFTRISITIASLTAFFLSVFDQTFFYEPYSDTATQYFAILFVLTIVSAVLTLAFCRFSFEKKALLCISFFIMIAATSLLCLQTAIENFREIHHTGSSCDGYVYINGKEIPTCPVY